MRIISKNLSIILAMYLFAPTLAGAASESASNSNGTRFDAAVASILAASYAERIQSLFARTALNTSQQQCICPSLPLNERFSRIVPLQVNVLGTGGDCTYENDIRVEECSSECSIPSIYKLDAYKEKPGLAQHIKLARNPSHLFPDASWKSSEGIGGASVRVFDNSSALPHLFGNQGHEFQNAVMHARTMKSTAKNAGPAHEFGYTDRFVFHADKFALFSDRPDVPNFVRLLRNSILNEALRINRKLNADQLLKIEVFIARVTGTDTINKMSIHTDRTLLLGLLMLEGSQIVAGGEHEVGLNLEQSFRRHGLNRYADENHFRSLKIIPFKTGTYIMTEETKADDALAYMTTTSVSGSSNIAHRRNKATLKDAGSHSYRSLIILRVMTPFYATVTSE